MTNAKPGNAQDHDVIRQAAANLGTVPKQPQQPARNDVDNKQQQQQPSQEDLQQIVRSEMRRVVQVRNSRF